MPYIKKFREELKNKSMLPVNEGELNFLITCTIIDYISYNGKSYRTLNEVIGALECAKLEFYRRMIVPYENKKIKENSDVYPSKKNKKCQQKIK